MLFLIIFILTAVGLTNIIVNESVLNTPKQWVFKTFPHSMLTKMLKCATCAGFWCGIIVILCIPNLLMIPAGIFFKIFIAGCISSISNKIIAILMFKF